MSEPGLTFAKMLLSRKEDKTFMETLELVVRNASLQMHRAKGEELRELREIFEAAYELLTLLRAPQ